MIYFLDGPLVIMLILGFFCPLLLFFTLIIFATSLASKVENASLICKMSSTFHEMLAFEACIYNFLILESFGTFLLTELTFMSERGGLLLVIHGRMELFLLTELELELELEFDLKKMLQCSSSHLNHYSS